MPPNLHIRRTEGPGVPCETLFVSPTFCAFQAQTQAKRLLTFTAADATEGDIASLTFALGAEGWTNPVTGAFGGVAAHAPPRASSILALVETATKGLRAEGGASRAILRLAPDGFADSAAAPLENALFRSGWELAQVDLDQYLVVSSAADFAHGLGETKQKELRRLKRSGAAFRTTPLQEGEIAHRVIAANRAARGFPMTMSWPQIRALAEACPHRVGVHVVERAGAVLAGAVVLHLRSDYSYVFYWGEAPEARRESPIGLLAEGLVGESQARGVRILDIGVSTAVSEPNLGLLEFKTSLGCQIAAKRTYCLQLT